MQLPEQSAIVSSEQLACERPIIKETEACTVENLSCSYIMVHDGRIDYKGNYTVIIGQTLKVELLH